MKVYLFGNILCLLLLGTTSLVAQDTAYPKAGDGIHSFLRRYDRVGDSYVKAFRELNTGKFTAKGGLIMGRKYIIPPFHPEDKRIAATEEGLMILPEEMQAVPAEEVQPDSIQEEQPLSPEEIQPIPAEKAQSLPLEAISRGTDPSIFGKKLSDMQPQSDRLRNTCFYIISGHGGPDPGAIARVGNRVLHEDEYAYDIALRLARNLMMEGATVYVIIQDPKDGIRDEMYLNNSSNETCMGKAIPRNQLERLKQRVDKVNEFYQRDKNKYDYIRAIDLHVDSRSKGKRIDVFFYHSNDNQSKKLATTMRDYFRMKYDTHQPGRGFGGFVEQRNLYVLRNLQPPSILVETGNIQNDFDRRRILQSDNRQALANWMAQAFYEDYKKNNRK